MRVDVHLSEESVESELATLYERPQLRGVLSSGVPGSPTCVPHVHAYTRHCDGEHFFYLVDVSMCRLAGYTVFSRMVELPKRADRHCRSPHSKVHPAYQRMGLATWAYRSMLASGMCLVSGARQSAAAHRLWMRLGHEHPLRLVDIAGREVRLREAAAFSDVPDDLPTRMILLGKGWSTENLCVRAGVASGPVGRLSPGRTEPRCRTIEPEIACASA